MLGMQWLLESIQVHYARASSFLFSSSLIDINAPQIIRMLISDIFFVYTAYIMDLLKLEWNDKLTSVEVSRLLPNLLKRKYTLSSDEVEEITEKLSKIYLAALSHVNGSGTEPITLSMKEMLDSDIS